MFGLDKMLGMAGGASNLGALSKVSRKPSSAPPSSAPPSSAPPSLDMHMFDPGSDPAMNSILAGYSGAGMTPPAQPMAPGVGGSLGGLAHGSFLSRMANGLSSAAQAVSSYGQPQMRPDPFLDPVIPPYERNPYAGMSDEDLLEFLRRAETDPSFVDSMLTRVE